MATLVSPLWRWLVTDLGGSSIMFLDKLASERNVTPNLNDALVLTGTVPSDNPQVSQLHTDNLPLLAEGARLLYGFRRESDTAPYYTIRASTLILQTDDASRSEDARTRFTAFDPWKYLFYRPIYIERGEAGYSLIPRKGWVYDSVTYADASLIVLEWLGYMGGRALNFGVPSDAATWGYIDFGQTGFYTGTIEVCPGLAAPGFPVEPGTSIGQAMQDLCAHGVMDIVLSPIYDPINRPGYLCELNIYAQYQGDPDSGAGARNYTALFGWDRPPRSLVGFDDLIDGTQRANVVQFRDGTAGPLVAAQIDTDSMNFYGEYWAEQAFPAETRAPPAVVSIAAEQLDLRKNYKQTLTVNPAPERSPEPFVDYYLGDRVPIYIGQPQRGTYVLGENSSRQTLPPGYSGAPPSPDPAVYVWQRIYGIPVDIDDNGTETVRELLVGPIGPPVPPAPAPPVGAAGGGTAAGQSVAVGTAQRARARTSVNLTRLPRRAK